MTGEGQAGRQKSSQARDSQALRLVVGLSLRQVRGARSPRHRGETMLQHLRAQPAEQARWLDINHAQIAVIGLGYVGLPLAVAFARQFPTIGFDVSERRIGELSQHQDRTREVEPAELAATERLSFASSLDAIASCNVFVVAVPTPVDAHNQPDLTALIAASQAVGQVIKPGDVVVFESTVYPGATEEVCVPEIERASGLAFNGDFFAGYSPERANPGDSAHRLSNIIKVVAGSTRDVGDFLTALYGAIVPAGVHQASSIRVAEAAKVIENTQRDLNIALVNELAIIFNRLGIDTEEVLEAAGTKWNFLPFRPGLVGGHCIGVDPYYLCQKAQAVGYHPEVILAGRRINDGMGRYVVGQLVKHMIRKRIHVDAARVLVMGLTFKENCPDLRNTRVIDIVDELNGFNAVVDVYDPWVDPDEAANEYGIRPIAKPEPGGYDAIVLAVAHQLFRDMKPSEIASFGRRRRVIYDLKHVLPKALADLRL
jgi:UDP-N-acetyl-D-glucosamine/UDP-N-acetyl-D-galactosamine dehydrogenase